MSKFEINKMIMIDYQEYLEMEKVFKTVKCNCDRSYNYPPSIEKITEYIVNKNLFDMLKQRNDTEEIIIRKV